MNRYERMNQERKIVDVRKRVAAYCRVSTDHEDQANSFESQQRYFTGNILSATPIGSFTRFSRTKASPAPTPKSAVNSSA